MFEITDKVEREISLPFDYGIIIPHSSFQISKINEIIKFSFHQRFRRVIESARKIGNKFFN